MSAQIGFAPGGNVLVVTHRDLGVIDTFRVAADRSPAPAQPHTSDASQPFGFAFAGSHLEVTNAGSVAMRPDTTDPSQLKGSVSSYDVVDSGARARLGRRRHPSSLKCLALEQDRASPDARTTRLRADRAVAMVLGVSIALLGTRGA